MWGLSDAYSIRNSTSSWVKKNNNNTSLNPMIWLTWNATTGKNIIREWCNRD